MSAPLTTDPSTAVSEHTAIISPPASQSVETGGNGEFQSHAPNKSYPSPEAEYEQICRNKDLFFEKLRAFHISFRNKFKVPIIGGNALDLHRLFVEVTSRGGIDKVINDRRWKEVALAFNFPPTITNASFSLRKNYMSLLYHFEQVYYFRKKAISSLDADSASRTVNQSASAEGLTDVAVENLGSGSPHLEDGSLVTGFIDGKCDVGYLVTVNLGDEKLKGVLYHVPAAEHSGNEGRRGQASSYGPLFSDQYSRLKNVYRWQERGP